MLKRGRSEKEKVEKMRIKTIGACLIVSFLALLLLSNTVSATDGPVGPPIGVQVVEFDPGDTVLPGESVNVTIKWWITNESYTYYKGPFGLKIGLKNNLTGTEIEDWKIHTNKSFDYEANESYPYIFEFTKDAPDEIGAYTLELQITATNITRAVGNQERYLLLASAEEPITTVPEFTTIAIPVAAILGLLFLFNHRKRRKAE